MAAAVPPPDSAEEEGALAARAEEASALLRQAEELRVSDALEETIRTAEASLAIFKELKNLSGQADALRCIISALRDTEKGKPTMALRRANDELVAFKAVGDRRGEASMMLTIADINTDKRGSKKREEGLVLAHDAAEIFREVDEPKLEAAAVFVVSNIYIKKCDKGGGLRMAREAARYASKALERYREAEDRKGEARCLHNLAIAKWYNSEAPFKEGLKFAKEALAIYRDLGSKKLEAAVLYVIADWHHQKGLGREGLRYAKDALELFRSIGYNNGWETAALISLIRSYVAKDDASAAIQVATDGLERFQSTGDKLGEANCLEALTSAHLANEDNDEAIRAAEDALSVYQELGNRQAEAHALQTVSQVYFRSEQMAEALQSYQDSASICQELGHTREQARTTCLVSRMHLMNREFDQALQAAYEALKLFQKAENRRGEACALLEAAAAHLMKEEHNLAVGEAEEAKAIFQKEEDRLQEASALQMLAEIHSSSQDHEAALRAATAARAIYLKSGEKREEATMLLRVAQTHITLAVSAVDKDPAVKTRYRKSWGQALKAGKEALSIARKVAGKPGKYLAADAQCSVAQVQGMTGKYREALKSSNAALATYAQQADERGQASVLILIGEIHLMNGDRNEAKTAANKALAMAQRNRDQLGESLAMYLLGILEPREMAPAGFVDVGKVSRPPTAAVSAPTPGPYAGPTIPSVIPQIHELAISLLNVDDLPKDSPLMDAGLDSLSMVQFRNSLQKHFPGVPMPASLLFDNPSVRAVSENIVSELKAAHYEQRPLL